jgi:hypothetical protein
MTVQATGKATGKATGQEPLRETGKPEHRCRSRQGGERTPNKQELGKQELGKQELGKQDGDSGNPAVACPSREAILDQEIWPGHTDRQSLLHRLRLQARCISTAEESSSLTATFSTGSVGIDPWLPAGGLRVDAITEWVSQGEGSGAASLALIAAANLLRCPRHGRGPLLVVSDEAHFYPPAAVALGIPAERMVWVRPQRAADQIWSIDQALRCESVAAVLAPLGAKLDDRDARRFQLAAEAGRTPGLFIRPEATRHRPSFAEVRLHVANLDAKLGNRARTWLPPASRHAGRLLQVTLDRCRGGRLGEKIWIQIGNRGDLTTVTPPQSFIGPDERALVGDEKATVHLASELAHPKTSVRRAKRA